MHFLLRFQILKEENSDTVALYPEDGRVRKFLPDCTASQPKIRCLHSHRHSNLKTELPLAASCRQTDSAFAT
jgi:hypothetical protein